MTLIIYTFQGNNPIDHKKKVILVWKFVLVVHLVHTYNSYYVYVQLWKLFVLLKNLALFPVFIILLHNQLPLLLLRERLVSRPMWPGTAADSAAEQHARHCSQQFQQRQSCTQDFRTANTAYCIIKILSHQFPG